MVGAYRVVQNVFTRVRGMSYISMKQAEYFILSDLKRRVIV